MRWSREWAVAVCFSLHSHQVCLLILHEKGFTNILVPGLRILLLDRAEAALLDRFLLQVCIMVICLWERVAVCFSLHSHQGLEFCFWIVLNLPCLTDFLLQVSAGEDSNAANWRTILGTTKYHGEILDLKLWTDPDSLSGYSPASLQKNLIPAVVRCSPLLQVPAASHSLPRPLDRLRTLKN